MEEGTMMHRRSFLATALAAVFAPIAAKFATRPKVFYGHDLKFNGSMEPQPIPLDTLPSRFFTKHDFGAVYVDGQYVPDAMYGRIEPATFRGYVWSSTKLPGRDADAVSDGAVLGTARPNNFRYSGLIGLTRRT
jgi:hypothetical protein